MPVENLLSPDAVRRLCWTPPDDLDADVIAELLREHGARVWQRALTAPVLAAALRRVRDQPA
jgi:ribonuclease D